VFTIVASFNSPLWCGFAPFWCNLAPPFIFCVQVVEAHRAWRWSWVVINQHWLKVNKPSYSTPLLLFLCIVACVGDGVLVLLMAVVP